MWQQTRLQMCYYWLVVFVLHSAFNNILSNLGYVLLGLLFLLIVLKRDIVHNRALVRNSLNALVKQQHCADVSFRNKYMKMSSHSAYFLSFVECITNPLFCLWYTSLSRNRKLHRTSEGREQNTFKHIEFDVSFVESHCPILSPILLSPTNQECGIPKHFGLFYAMGTALMMEGLLSACYHVCPNYTNFQFGKCVSVTLSVATLKLSTIVF